MAQGAERAVACLLASGRNVFRIGAGRAGHRLDRAHRRDTGDGLRKDHPRQPRDRPASAQGHILARQPAVARSDHRAQAGLLEVRDDAAHRRTDIAAPHPHRAFVRAESNGPAPHRHRRQLHPAALPPGQRHACHRHPGARARRVRAFRSGAAADRRLRRWFAGGACRGGGAVLRVQTSCWRRAADRGISESELPCPRQ